MVRADLHLRDVVVCAVFEVRDLQASCASWTTIGVLVAKTLAAVHAGGPQSALSRNARVASMGHGNRARVEASGTAVVVGDIANLVALASTLGIRVAFARDRWNTGGATGAASSP